MSYLLTMKQLACLATLVYQPVPQENLEFYVVEENILAVAIANAGLPSTTVALYDPQLKVASIPPNYATRTNKRNPHVHEAVHYILDVNHVSHDWRNENLAAYGARKFEVWC